MALFRLTALAFFIAAAFTPQRSYAADNIEFIAKEALKGASTHTIAQSYNFAEIASTDLNQDGINEFILKHNKDNKASEFRIIAQNNSGNVELGVIEANRLMISYNRLHGVRSILAFNDLHNDFDYDVYQWSAKDLRYTHKKRDEQGDKI